MAMADLFQHTLVLSAQSPFSLTSSLKQMQIRVQSLEQRRRLCAPLNGCDYCHLLLKLCDSLSALAGDSACIAFPVDEGTVYVIYKVHRSISLHGEDIKKDVVKNTINKHSKSFQISIDELTEETPIHPISLRSAVQHGLRMALFRQGWITLDAGHLFLRINQLVSLKDGQPVAGMSMVNVQVEPNGQIVLLVSLDTVLFRRFKLENILPDSLQRKYEGRCEVFLEDALWNATEETIHGLKCCVLPYLTNGYVVGCSKSPPKSSVRLQEAYEELWQYKHGLVVPEPCSYLKVCPTLEAKGEGIWFPSCCVLTKAGLMPATASVRASNVPMVLERLKSDVKDLGDVRILTAPYSVSCHPAWNIFDTGGLCFEISPPSSAVMEETTIAGWVTAKDVLHTLSKDERNRTRTCAETIKSSRTTTSGAASSVFPTLLNFRRQKPVPYKAPQNQHSTMEKSVESEASFQPSEAKGRPPSSARLQPVTPARILLVPRFGPRKRRQSGEPSSSVLVEGKMTKKAVTDVQGSAVMATGKEKQITVATSQSTRNISQPPKETAKRALYSTAVTLDVVNLPESRPLGKSKTKAQAPHRMLATQPLADTSPALVIVPKKKRVGKPESRNSLGAPCSEPESAKTTGTKALNSVVSHSKLELAVEELSPGVPRKPVRSASPGPAAAIVKTSRGSKGAAGDIDQNANDIKVRLKHAEGRLKDLTVNELKNFLASQNVKASARKKDELIERVIQLLLR